MHKINIITRCTRPQYLEEVRKSVYNTDLFEIKWWVAFDSEIIKDVDSSFLSNLQEMGGESIFYKGKKGDFGHSILSKIIDRIDYGFIYIIDDDNIIHNNFYNRFYSILNENEDKDGFIFSQNVSGKDFTKLDKRVASPDNVKVQHIDMAQFILNKDLIGNIRFRKNEYKADGYFIEEIYSLNKDRFIIKDEILCHYNYLRQTPNFTPKVLFIGDNEPVLKSHKHMYYESDDLRVLYRKDDLDIEKDLKSWNPDCIITNSNSWKNYSKLSCLSEDIRSRWIHLDEITENSGEMAYQCAMTYILNNDKNIVSYFTPIYNIGDKLKQTYQSLKNQTNYNWEWILVNDSTDGGLTLKIAEELSENDNRVKVYDFREKSGGIVGESKYRAASLTNGQILAELDHDDYIMPTCTQTLINAYEKYPDCGFYYTDCVEIDSNWNSLTYGEGFAFGYGSYRDEVIFGKPMKVCNSLNINPKTIRHIVGVPNHVRAWRRDVYFKIGGHNRRLSIADDYELIIRTFLNTKMLRIDKMEYLQFIHNDGGNTHNISRADIQRRVRTISNHYNLKIKNRFEELGFKDWAYEFDQSNPLMSSSRFDENEGYVNLIYT